MNRHNKKHTYHSVVVFSCDDSLPLVDMGEGAGVDTVGAWGDQDQAWEGHGEEEALEEGEDHSLLQEGKAVDMDSCKDLELKREKRKCHTGELLSKII